MSTANRAGAHSRAAAANGVDRWIVRIITNPEATIGMLRSGELNFLGDYSGDPEDRVDVGGIYGSDPIGKLGFAPGTN